MSEILEDKSKATGDYSNVVSLANETDRQKLQRKKRNQELVQKAEYKIKQRGAPYYGANESDVLDLKVNVQQLVQNNNGIVQSIEALKKRLNDQDEKILENTYVVSSLKDILLGKGIIAREELVDTAQSKQLSDEGLMDKPNGIVEVGDTVLMKFKIMCEDKVVDDQTNSLMAYVIGSGVLSCEREMLGMKAGESGLFDVAFSEVEKFKEYEGKQLKIEIQISGVKTRKV